MKSEYRELKSFEEELAYCIHKYADGNCDLDSVLTAANKIACYKANVGINTKRLESSPREKAFHDNWLHENAPISHINHGHGILQDLFIETTGSFSILLGGKMIEEINNRDRMIVATVIQWLGTNCGMAFLEETLNDFGARIVYDKKEK